MFGRISLDNVKLYDKRDTLLLQASRIAASVNLVPLVERKIRISGVQLIGAKAKLYKDGENPFNFQFLVDAFSSKDTTSSPLDLAIGALVVRRGEISFDLLDKPRSSTGFDYNHVCLKDLSLTARVLFRKSDTLALDLRNLSFVEQSGLHLKHFSLEAEAGKHGAIVRDFLLELPHTSLNTSLIQAFAQEDWSRCTGYCPMLNAQISPSDLACLSPMLVNFTDAVNLTAEAHLSNDILRLTNLSVGDDGNNLSLRSDITIQKARNDISLFADVKELRTSSSLSYFLAQNLQGQAGEINPVLSRVGSTKSSGTLSYQNRNLHANLLTESEQGTLSLNATLHDMQDIEAEVTAKDVKLGNLLDLSGKGRGTTLSLETNVTGCLPRNGRQADLAISGLLSNLIYNGYGHRNIPFAMALDGEVLSAEVTMDEPNGWAKINLQTAKQNGRRPLSCEAQLKDFAPHNMNLTNHCVGERFSLNASAEFTDINPDNLQGSFRLTNVKFVSANKGTLKIGDIDFNSSMTETGHHLSLQSDFLNVRADGTICWQTLPVSFIKLAHLHLPSLFSVGSRQQQPSGNNFRFFVEAQDTLVAGRLFDSSFRLPEKSRLEGTISDAIGQIALQLNIPQLQIAGQQLQSIICKAEGGTAPLQASLQCEQVFGSKPLELSIDAYATKDKVISSLRWDNKRGVSHVGEVNFKGVIRRDHANQMVVDVGMNESRLVVGDSTWHINPASITYHDKVIDVKDFSLSQAEKHINIGGRISSLASDTLKAELQEIDISYIMDLINFHKVDFDGLATGSIYATSLMAKPYADAFLHVKDFSFNTADLGNMDLYANWGRQERAISLNANISSSLSQHRTKLQGTIIPGRGKEDGLNLNIQTSYFDLSFLNKFTKDIFRDLQGRASGWTRVFGPFKEVNLEGDMFINEMKMHVLALGTDYHLAGDSVSLRPDNIWLRGAHVYDHLGMPGMNEHSAVINAHLMHDALKSLRYDINIDAYNLLGYNFPHQGGQNFFGTAYADAQVHLNGEPGVVNIDIAATPMPGTTFVYNAASPERISETEFVTYVKRGEEDKAKGGSDISTANELQSETSLPSASDLRINFDINANPNAQIRILLDPTMGDNLFLYGNGHLRANYYNKGRFQLFGTYRVSEGNYNMSIRDVIRKEFTFLPDGTVVFGGDAMQAALNLKAKHTVPNVSLDDLSTTGLGLSNTRVDCIMNIGGIAREPVISFDFDIPNANEDEKQMIRSMLSSEEERDMQAIYLLGVGRFYTYGTMVDTRQTKGGMAVNSVLSSLLSSRFNQIMSQALWGSNWSFGTNLRTGEEGWEHMDVEGSLSGKMLSGRLIFNGNFGYRENKYRMNGNNFIGDFDLQYRLSPRSPFSLKVYNQTNDRYFTQSSLTTQGVGIKFQRDFNRFQEIFLRTKKKEK